MNTYAKEVSKGMRFEFGKNWQQFLASLNEERIKEAEKSLIEMLGYTTLEGKKFLDIGSGSGLFSLAARRLGAHVYSFDYDPQSVACTLQLKARYYPDDINWIITEGSALDEDYIKSLGNFDIVYSWGVLHHTGNMWKALHNAQLPLQNEGLLLIAIYNDQQFISSFWRKIKKTYCSGLFGKYLTMILFLPYLFLLNCAAGIVKYKNPLKQFSEYKKKRGMSIYHDWLDWLGGYPFEVAKPEDIFNFYQQRGFVLQKMITTNRNGCNQFVFKKMVIS